MIDELLGAATSMIRGVPPWDGWVDTDLGGVRIRRIAHSQSIECDFRGPLCGIVLQGGKRIVTGERQFGSTAGDAVIVSHHIPAVSTVIEGSEERPYIGLMMPIDMTLLNSLAHELRDATFDGTAIGPIGTMRATPDMLNAFMRLLALESKPVEARVLVPLIVKEIHLRFLMAPAGSILRALLARDSQASRISQVIAHMRANSSAASVASLAQLAGMGASSFHAHFKAVTGLAPLAFQKELRLMRARSLLLDPEHNVSSVAFAVGYESATQFSREYSRRFGSSPRDHRHHP